MEKALKKAFLQRRQYKNDVIQSKTILILKLPGFFLAVYKWWKIPAISKLELYLTEKSRSYIVLALVFTEFKIKFIFSIPLCSVQKWESGKIVEYFAHWGFRDGSVPSFIQGSIFRPKGKKERDKKWEGWNRHELSTYRAFYRARTRGCDTLWSKGGSKSGRERVRVVTFWGARACTHAHSFL